MSTKGRITGLVGAPTGPAADSPLDPVPGAFVEVRQNGVVVSTGRSDARGRFAVPAPAGTSVAYARRTSDGPAEASALVALEGGGHVDVALRLDPGAR